MEAIKMLKERRSIRKFTNQKVDREIMKEIVDVTRFYPSWANFQSVRYNIIDNAELITKLAEIGFANPAFKQNRMMLERATGVVVISYIKGESGTYPKGGEYVTKKGATWDMFDAGIATQTFCLAAYEKEIGTVILGLFDEDKVAEVLDLPENEVVATVIPYGYYETHPNAPKRLEVEELARFK